MQVERRRLRLAWTGEQSVGQAKCLAEQNNGLYITVDTEQELVGALEKDSGLPNDIAAR
jgi:hypothetical protein